MTIHRFYIPEIKFDKDSISLVLPQEVSWQIAKVLRLQIGDTIGIFDGSGKEYRVLLKEVNKYRVSGVKTEEFTNTSESKINITLYQSLLPANKFEEVLEKGTEIGIKKFIPLETDRTVVKKKNIKEEKLLRWQKIVKEAAEQSERGAVPVVGNPTNFLQAIEQALNIGRVLIAWEGEKDTYLKDIGNTEDLREKEVAIFIGPEGGFTNEEISLAKEKGAKTVSLGPRILRSETAGLFFSDILFYIFGELNSSRF